MHAHLQLQPASAERTCTWTCILPPTTPACCSTHFRQGQISHGVRYAPLPAVLSPYQYGPVRCGRRCYGSGQLAVRQRPWLSDCTDAHVCSRFQNWLA
eukprot:365966-Chlamydomonas_euryale.AAC.7